MSKLLLITTPSLHDRDGDSFVVEVEEFGVVKGVLFHTDDKKQFTYYAPGAWLTAEEVTEADITIESDAENSDNVPVLND